MDAFDPAVYGDSVAEIYDERLSETQRETNLTVDFLAPLAAELGGPVLELGIGTGRVAIPLAERGFTVHGIDASPKMLEKLRTKPGAERIEATLGDFSDLSALHASYGLIFLVFNTLFALTTQEAQIRCFASVAERLRPGGKFVVHAFVPDPVRLAQRQYIEIRSVDVDSVRLNLSRYDPTIQKISMVHLVIDARGTHLYPVPMRYAYPAEIDLMARLAGLVLRERWSSYTREPFAADSRLHLSIYERPAL
jgi:SAM-dependent methyltransferase